jgi:hypothetical protein
MLVARVEQIDKINSVCVTLEDIPGIPRMPSIIQFSNKIKQEEVD